jgi:Domain of unknown function (DUF2383)
MNTEFVLEMNTLLSEELGAVQSYDLALERAKSAKVVSTLERCRQCHFDRSQHLRSKIEADGGDPTENSGLWGGFDKWVQQSASGERDAVALLEESEAERLVNYEADRSIVPPEVLQVIDQELLPAQHETHLAVSVLLRDLAA